LFLDLIRVTWKVQDKIVPPSYPAQKQPVWRFDQTNPPEIGFHGGGRVCLSDEVVDVSDWNDRQLGRVFSSRHPEVISWDDGEARIVEDTPEGDGVSDACEGRSRLDPRY
jgi:hypothetical protein